MAKPKDPYPIPIREMTGVLSKISNGSNDWSNPQFSVQKAYVCSVFAQWAYAEIPEWEMKVAEMKRVKLFNASLLFDYLTSAEQKRQQSSLEVFMREQGDRVNLVTTITDNLGMVALVLRMGNVIFISLRGTIMWDDYFVDAFAIKRYPLKKHPHCGFHRGFYIAVAQSFRTLRDAILKMSSNPLIYVTGHSLGGAMSGILYGLWNLDEFRKCNYPRVHSAYTFGMPRFGDAYAMEFLEKYNLNDHTLRGPLHPYHMMHPLDNMPLVPSRGFFDYADSVSEWWACEDIMLNGRKIGSQAERDNRGFWSKMEERCSKWPHHDINKYIENTSLLC
jgi:hypothetical protein